jgi:prepilin-type N-terminal cleavage/methylation domain-containing protein
VAGSSPDISHVNFVHELIRRATDDEEGFTLIELLVVMLIIANLAAIALPTFFKQKTKANDVKAKAVVNSAQVAMETCATANLGLYTSCDLAALRVLAPEIPATGVIVENTGGGYTIKVTAVGSNTYSITRSATGLLTYPCTVASSDRGGCPGVGTAAGTWG